MSAFEDAATAKIEAMGVPLASAESGTLRLEPFGSAFLLRWDSALILSADEVMALLGATPHEAVPDSPGIPWASTQPGEDDPWADHVWPCPLFYKGNWNRVENGWKPSFNRQCNCTPDHEPEPDSFNDRVCECGHKRRVHGGGLTHYTWCIVHACPCEEFVQTPDHMVRSRQDSPDSEMASGTGSV